MTSQVAFAAILLVGAGLSVRSFDRLRHVDAGFRSDDVLTFRVSLIPRDYPDAERVASFHRELLGRIGAMPGVRAAGVTSRLPLTGGFEIDPLSVRGRSTAEVPPIAEMRLATPGYFEAMGIPLLRGRTLDSSDVDTRSGAVVVTDRVAREFFGGTDALGQGVAHGVRGVPGEREWSDVVGVVGDVRGVSPFEPPMGAVYYPMLTRPGVEMEWLARSVAYVIRADGDPTGLVPGIRRAVGDLDSDLAVADVRLLDDVVAASRARATFATILLATGAGLGLLLGAVGLFGATSVSVARRTREIGLRIALGATPRSVRSLIVGQSLGSAMIGLAAGLGAAALLARFISGILFEVDHHDPLTYSVVAAVLFAIA
jgi:putative ABC transport system permease protein